MHSQMTTASVFATQAAMACHKRCYRMEGPVWRRFEKRQLAKFNRQQARPIINESLGEIAEQEADDEEEQARLWQEYRGFSAWDDDIDYETNTDTLWWPGDEPDERDDDFYEPGYVALEHRALLEELGMREVYDNVLVD